MLLVLYAGFEGERRQQVEFLYLIAGVAGLLILSIGSDLPELAVAVDAGIKGLLGRDASAVVVGTSVGSVVAQIGFVLGVVGVISVLKLERGYVYRHGATLLGATLFLYWVALDGQVTRFEGAVLIALYAGYVLALMNGANLAVQRGIIIGAALGAAAMSLRIMLGIERTYMGK